MGTTPIFWIIVAVCSASMTMAIWYAFRMGQKRAGTGGAELSHLNELGRQLLRSQLSVDALCEMVYWQVGQIVPTPLFQLGLFDGDAYIVKIWVQDSRRIPEKAFPQGANKGIVGWVRDTGQPLLIANYEAERDRLPAFPEFDLADPPHSGLFVPLIAGTVTIGIIAVQSRQTAHFNNEHLRLLTALANQVAWAIRNAQLYEKAQRRAEQLNLIGQVTAQVSTAQPLPDLFKQIVTLTKETFGYYCVSIFVSEHNQLRNGASTHQKFFQKMPIIEVGKGLVGWAAQEAKTALANNTAEDDRYRQIRLLPETRSEIALPLKVENRVLGVLDVQSDRVDAFDNEDVFVLETLAAQAALAVEQAQTYDAEHRLAQRLETLFKVSQTVVSVIDLDELLAKVIELIADIFGFERSHIFLLTEDGHLEFRAGTGPHKAHWQNEEMAHKVNDPGLIPKAARTGTSEIVGDVSQSGDYRPGPGLEDTRSEMVIPIKMAGRILGIIDLQSRQLNAFAEEDLTVMQSLADTVAVAIRNASLYANERRRRNLAETLREISATIASDLDLDRVLARILEGLSKVVTLDAAAILLAEEGAGTLMVMATTGSKLEGIVGRQLPIRTLVSDDKAGLREAISHVYHDLLALPEEHTCTIAPLTVSSQLIGYLIVDHHRPGHYSKVDEEIVVAFANQAAVAINNARLYSAQQSEAWVTAALLQVAEAVNAQVGVENTLETIARLTALVAGVSHCLIFRWEPGSRSFYRRACHLLPGSETQDNSLEPLPADADPMLTQLLDADKPIGAGQGHALPIPESLANCLLASSIIGFPLRSKNELVGLLIVDDPHQGKPLEPRLFNILIGIAHQTATALDAAALQASQAERSQLEQELRVAHQIQASFIPDAPPQETGWQMTAIWRAARQVSGDFYDFIPLREELWGLVIADVADKGVPAALFMAMCRTLMRAAAINRTSPAATLTRANELIFNDSRTDLFITMLYAVWDPLTNEVVYAGAGHNPMLLIRKKKREVIELQRGGIALGIIPRVGLKEHRITMAPGDTLVAYTDGLTEAMRVNYEEWGLDRLKSTLKKVSGQSAQQIIDAVLSEVDAFVGDAPQSDDLTMWVLKRDE
ncbi:MAG: GAF domain-containing protein [Anaerolineae bacterium]|nr:GAF domain-containing protein [Anaerolineae bacterium]